MIIPWLKGFLGFSKAPLTWMLLLSNVLMFLATIDSAPKVRMSALVDSRSMELSGRLYYQYLNSEETKLPLKSINEWVILGSQGLRNPEFIKAATEYGFFGDQVAISKWKKDVAQYQRELAQRTSTVFGLNTEKWSWTSWITYQFMHAGFIHLMSNMLLLWIFAAAVESAVGGFTLILIYLLSGFAGGLGYFYLGGNTLVPMVGASGSLSGVMAFYAIYEVKKRVSFFYFLSPLKGYFGWIYLPTLLIFPLCFLPDVVGYLSTPEEIGTGVAYTAHIGGAVFGVLLGLLCRALKPTLKPIFKLTTP